jgi:hypothetical protein
MFEWSYRKKVVFFLLFLKVERCKKAGKIWYSNKLITDQQTACETFRRLKIVVVIMRIYLHCSGFVFLKTGSSILSWRTTF